MCDCPSGSNSNGILRARAGFNSTSDQCCDWMSEGFQGKQLMQQLNQQAAKEKFMSRPALFSLLMNERNELTKQIRESMIISMPVMLDDSSSRERRDD